MEKKLYIYTDGASRGNPGKAAIAFIVVKNGKLVKKYGKTIGIATNNEAEYKAVIKALQTASSITSGDIILTSDSEVVTSQLTGKYKVRASNLRELFRKVKSEEEKFSSVSYRHSKRSNPHISMVDRIANHALNRE